MNIIILGAGRVGTTLCEVLSKENHDITLVDQDANKLRILQDRLDLRTVIGHGAHPDILERAGAAKANMIISVTECDEINMVACQVAYSVFNIKTKIARVRAQQYFNHGNLFGDANMPIDVFIRPEQLLINNICELIDNPGALQILSFAEGRVKLVAIKPFYGGPLLGKPLSKIQELMPGVQTRVAAIFRDNQSIPLSGSTVIEIGDEVFFIANAQSIRTIMSALRRIDQPYSNIMIAGGGHIGSGLAHALEQDYQIKVIEHNPERCHYLVEHLSESTVLVGDATDEELLVSENIEHMDVFCAMTNEDEVNVLSCMLAKRFGARQTMALINRPAYMELIEEIGINIAISPEQATTSNILAHVRGGPLATAHALRRGAAEAIEAIAYGTEKTSNIIGKRTSQLKLPSSVNFGAIVRGDEILIANEDIEIQSEDHVILFITDKKQVRYINELFSEKKS